jgi:hypothetical protein
MNKISLEAKIREAINQESAENESNTPDWVLAEYLIGCLDNWNKATINRDKYFGYRKEKGNE